MLFENTKQNFHINIFYICRNISISQSKSFPLIVLLLLFFFPIMFRFYWVSKSKPFECLLFIPFLPGATTLDLVFKKKQLIVQVLLMLFGITAFNVTRIIESFEFQYGKKYWC